MATGSELTYNTSASAMQMANAIFGDGVKVISASYSGDPSSSAIYSRGDSRAPEATPSDSGVILSTGRVTDFTQSWGDPNTSSSTSTDTWGVNNNTAFNALAGTNTYDAALLDVTFVPTGNVMTIQFTFSSEEYPEYINSAYNDMIGVWINGSPVEMSAGNGDVSVTNINGGNNANLYINNTGDSYNTEMDGFTLTLTLTIPVNSGVSNSIRIGIADVSDSRYDSNLLIAGDSIQTTLVALEDQMTMGLGGNRILDVLGNDVNTTGGTLTITQINGVSVHPGDSVTLPSGDVITLNSDGTLNVHTDQDADDVSFTYQVTSSTGATDIGMVTVHTVPCFARGTRILTPEGLRPVEDLCPGDLVLTRDQGAQPLRWIGARSVPARGAMAPVHLAAGALGAHGALTLSPQHRILLREPRAELLFGVSEVLVAAKDLVDGDQIIRQEVEEITYLHLLFDRHQVIWSEGLATESFRPGPQVMTGMEAAVQAEILALFPELCPLTGEGYGPAARRLLKQHEVQVLLAEGPLHRQPAEEALMCPNLAPPRAPQPDRRAA